MFNTKKTRTYAPPRGTLVIMDTMIDPRFHLTSFSVRTNEHLWFLLSVARFISSICRYNTDHIDLYELYAFRCHNSREDLIFLLCRLDVLATMYSSIIYMYIFIFIYIYIYRLLYTTLSINSFIRKMTQYSQIPNASTKFLFFFFQLCTEESFYVISSP